MLCGAGIVSLFLTRAEQFRERAGFVRWHALRAPAAAALPFVSGGPSPLRRASAVAGRSCLPVAVCSASLLGLLPLGVVVVILSLLATVVQAGSPDEVRRLNKAQKLGYG